MTWQELQEVISQMTDEQRKKKVMVSHERGVILYPIINVCNTDQYQWEMQVEEDQPFLCDT